MAGAHSPSQMACVEAELVKKINKVRNFSISSTIVVQIHAWFPTGFHTGRLLMVKQSEISAYLQRTLGDNSSLNLKK